MRRTWLPCLLFITTFAVLQAAWSFSAGTAVRRLAVDVATAQPAAWLIRQITPEVAVRAIGSSLRAPGGGINILNGCEGLEVLFLLCAALLVAPVRWHARLAGLVLAVPVVWLLNQVRVVTLFYAYRSDPDLFALLHGTVAPLALVVGVAALFLWFLQTAQTGKAAT